jgi:hypothetical protein
VANQQYDLRVGINFDPAKRDVREFAAFSAQQQRQLATNVAAATRLALAGATGGRGGQAGALLADIKAQIPAVAREMEQMFRRLGKEVRIDTRALSKDIDNLMSSKRKGFNRASVGGIPLFDPAGIPDPRGGPRIIVPRQDQDLAAIRRGFVDQTAANSAGLQAQATDLIQLEITNRRMMANLLADEVVTERSKLAAMLSDRGSTRAIASARVAIATLLARQREIEARATTAAQFAQQSELTLAREKVLTAQNELSLSQRNPALIANIATQRALLADILRRQAAIESQALASANARLGLTSLASNRSTGAITTVQSGQGTNLRNNPLALASLNQQIARSFTQTAVAAQKTTVAQNQTLTRFQRAYQSLHNQGAGRSGGPPTLGQFVGTRALSTAAFGLTGGLLYGGISFMRELITEAQELQVQFGITQSVFEEFGGTINGQTFDEYKKNVIDISRRTGVAADEIAAISRQLAGAFATIQEGGPAGPEGDVVLPNINAGEQVAELALQLGKIAGLPQQEIADAFSATVLAFQEDGESAVDVATRLGDAVVGLEAQFGVGTAEVLNFTSSLAPLASEMGFTLEQLAGFGAVVEQAVGSDVAAGENIGRIFASLRDNAGEVAILLESAGINASGLVSALADGDMPDALREIVSAYDEIGSNDALKQQIGTLIGGDRQARTFFAVLDRGAQIMQALGQDQDSFTGAQAERWEKYQDTVVATFERMQRAVEEFGLALFDAGLVDALVALAQAGELVADVARLMLEGFGAFNDLLNGLPAKILAAAAALKVLSLAGGLLTGGKGLSLAAAGFGAAGFLNPNRPGLTSPYTAKASVQGFQPGLAAGGMPFFLPYGSPGVDPRIGQLPPSSFNGLPYAPAGRQPAKYGLRGLAAGNAGKGGAMLAGLAGSLAVPIAAVAVTALVTEAQNIAGELDGMREDLRQGIRDEIAKGVTPAELREQIEPQRDADNDFGTDFTNAVTSGFGLLGDSKNATGVQLDEVQKAEKAGIDKMLEAVKKKTDLSDENRFFVEKFLASEGTDDGLREAMDALLADARENDPKLAEAFDNILAEEEATQKEAAATNAALASVESGRLQATTRSLEILYAKGEITLDEMVKRYRANARIQRQVYAAVKGKDPAKEQAALEAIVQEQENEFRAIEDVFNRRAEILNSISGDDPGALLSLKREQFAETRDPKRRIALALEIRELQQAIVQAEADMAATAEEEIAILREGFVPDESSALLIIEQVTTLNPEWRAFLISTFGGLQQASYVIEEAAALAVADGLTFADAMVQIIKRSIANAQANLDEFYQGMAKVYGPEGLQQIQAYVDGLLGEQQDRIDAIEEGAPDFDPAGGGNLGQDPAALKAAEDAKRKADAAEAERKAEEARREAQALANAQLDVEAARAGDDDLALARIAKRRAQIAYAYAQTASERTAAYAQIIEADNQIRDALIAQTEAQRDLLVAKSHDSPVEAARIAVANARDALARARGAAAQAEAQAALIRAQRAQRDAILELADAQTDILIAQAEATGDSVKAAQLALDKIRRQLARTDLNTTERRQLEAERIGAEAAVRDARLSEEQATIDYQLAIGDITKQQAISALQALLTIPKLTEEQIREINLAIKDLKSQLGQDFQYNLPTQLGLPTVYEVRRLGEGGGTGSSYQDNRTIDITINGTNLNEEQLTSAVVAAVGDPRRTGTEPRRF